VQDVFTQDIPHELLKQPDEADIERYFLCWAHEARRPNVQSAGMAKYMASTVEPLPPFDSPEFYSELSAIINRRKDRAP
jgi:hypothetical protein